MTPDGSRTPQQSTEAIRDTTRHPRDADASRQDRLFAAIRASWSAATSTHGDAWSPENPSWGQCDASSFVAWEHLGGELVLGEIFVEGDKTEFHYWNRIAGVDIDLTAEQFEGTEEIRQVAVLTSAEIAAKQGDMRPDVQRRIELLRTAVTDQLDQWLQ